MALSGENNIINVGRLATFFEKVKTLFYSKKEIEENYYSKEDIDSKGLVGVKSLTEQEIKDICK